MAETAITLDDELYELRSTLAAAIAAEDGQSHQVELDRLVWAYAGQQAARAVRQWAANSRHPVAEALANAADAEATGQVRGQSWAEGVERYSTGRGGGQPRTDGECWCD